MADIYSKKKRSEIMSRVQSRNTRPEKIVFYYLRTNHIYFQKHYKKVAGSPDVAIPGKRIAVFIDGDFWHGWHFNKWSENISDFWKLKISNNIKREKKNTRELRSQGWRVLRIWEHDLDLAGRRPVTLERLKNFILQQ